MNITELRQKSLTELETELLASKREHFNLRMQIGSNQLTKTHRVREVKRYIARIKTIIREMQQANVPAKQTEGGK